MKTSFTEQLSPNDLKSRELGWAWDHHLKALELPQGHLLLYLIRDVLVGVADWGASVKREHLTTFKHSIQDFLLREQALFTWLAHASKPATSKSTEAAWHVYIYESLIQEHPYPNLEPWYIWMETLEERFMPLKGQVTDPLALVTAAIKELPERFAPWEEERGQIYTLLLDMRVALRVHGFKLDETALSLEDPESAFTGYLEMYCEYYATLPDQDKARSRQEMEYGARLAWRIWQMMQRTGKPLKALLEWFAKPGKLV